MRFYDPSFSEIGSVTTKSIQTSTRLACLAMTARYHFIRHKNYPFVPSNRSSPQHVCGSVYPWSLSGWSQTPAIATYNWSAISLLWKDADTVPCVRPVGESMRACERRRTSSIDWRRCSVPCSLRDLVCEGVPGILATTIRSQTFDLDPRLSGYPGRIGFISVKSFILGTEDGQLGE